MFAILVLLSGLQGCLSVPVNYATLEADAEAKHFRCPEGMSRVYVFRDENFGSAYPLTLSIDERPIGDFAAMTYGVFDRQPGEFEFSSATPESASQVLVSAEAGAINYLWLEIKMGWMYPRVLLQKVDQQRGQQGVNRSKMITFARKERPQRGGRGTAWLVSPRHWVTNHHVVGDRTTIKLVTSEGTTVEARVLTSDPANDLAVLVSEVPYRGALPLRLASTPPKVGERVVAIGFPLVSIMGSLAKLTSGDISALAGLLDDPRYYQFSAPVQAGNSGGPLINSSGEVIGVVTSKLSWEATLRASGQMPEGVNYAVKVAYLRPMLEGISLEASIKVLPMSADEIFSSAGSAVFRVEQ